MCGMLICIHIWPNSNYSLQLSLQSNLDYFGYISFQKRYLIKY
jgi:hypothetical protein